MVSRAAALSVGAGQDDRTLVERAAKGDSWALRALYDRHAGRLLALALRTLGSRGDADEVVQETFVDAWRRAREFDEGRGSVGAWLTTLARTRAIDRLRSRAASGRAASSAAAEPADPPAGPPELAARAEVGLRVRDALGTLPSEQREALELAYFEGLSHREIAERTGEPLGTVKTRVRLGMEKLQGILADLGGSVS